MEAIVNHRAKLKAPVEVSRKRILSYFGKSLNTYCLWVNVNILIGPI